MLADIDSLSKSTFPELRVEIEARESHQTFLQQIWFTEMIFISLFSFFLSLFFLFYLAQLTRLAKFQMRTGDSLLPPFLLNLKLLNNSSILFLVTRNTLRSVWIIYISSSTSSNYLSYSIFKQFRLETTWLIHLSTIFQSKIIQLIFPIENNSKQREISFRFTRFPNPLILFSKIKLN